MRIGAVILAGGQSRRMGSDKAELIINGQPFLNKIAAELSVYEELLVSVDIPERYADAKHPMVADLYPGCGPISGLCSALKACASDALLAVPCDHPLFCRNFGEYLFSLLTEDIDVVVPITADGHIHPLCAVYRKNMAEVFERQIKTGNYRLRDAFENVRVLYAPADDFSEALLNVNTPEEYSKLIK